jgi:hypothetical protein
MKAYSLALTFLTTAAVAALALGFVSLWNTRTHLNTPPTAPDDEDPLPTRGSVEIEWAGKVDYELRRAAPRSGFIADRAAWVKLWKAYRGDEPVPEVDFDRRLVLVGLQDEPNQLRDVCVVFEDRRNLKVSYATTLLPYINNPTWCSYVFASVPRKGIRSVNGHPVPMP